MAPTRNGSLDYAKLIAACGIVWFHTHAPGAAYGYAGLGFFVILLVLFTTPATLRLGFAAFARSRAIRLLGPWLACCVFYGALKLAEIWVTPATFATEFAPFMWLTGPALHLWFLPFAFVAGLGLYPLLRGVVRMSQLARLPLVAGFGLLGLLALAWDPALPAPLAQWAYALPALCFALTLVCAGGGPLRQMGLVGGIGVIGLSAGWAGPAQLVLAGLLLALCAALPLPAAAASGRAARMAIAKEMAVPPYVIFPDKTLIEMAQHRPHSLDGMMQLNGVGAKKLERYGSEFLRVISDH